MLSILMIVYWLEYSMYKAQAKASGLWGQSQG